jgi:hypothetical protein
MAQEVEYDEDPNSTPGEEFDALTAREGEGRGGGGGGGGGEGREGGGGGGQHFCSSRVLEHLRGLFQRVLG